MLEDSCELFKSKINEKKHNSKNKINSRNIDSNPNFNEIVELFEKKLDKKNKYCGNFDIADQNF